MKWLKAGAWTLSMAPFAWGGVKLIRALPVSLASFVALVGAFGAMHLGRKM